MDPLMDGSIYSSVIIFIVAVGFCALFSFLETSITAIRLFKLKEIGESMPQYRQILNSLETNPTRLLSTILIASNLSATTASTTGTYLVDSLISSIPSCPSWMAFLLSILVTTLFTLICGDIVPKSIAKLYGERSFASTLWITNIFFYLLYPVVSIITRLTDSIIGLFKHEDDDADTYATSEQEVRFLIDYIDAKGAMESEKTSMLKSIFTLSQTQVKEIMVPSISVIKIPSEKSLQEAFDLFTTYQFTRIPVFEKQYDNIIGMLHLKDLVPLIAVQSTKTIKEIMRPIIFIPESVRVNQLLKQLKEKRMHIAMVINEHGAITGLVTLEDVLEEIVGDIKDEYESVPEKIVPLRPHGWLVDASIELKDLHEALKITFQREHALTLAGFLTEHLQRLPQKGERVVYKDYIFQIQQVSDKKIFQVLIFHSDHDELEKIVPEGAE